MRHIGALYGHGSALQSSQAANMIRIETPQQFIEHHHTLGLYCRSCDRWTEADLQKLVAMGKGDQSMVQMNFTCALCRGSMEPQVRPPTRP